MFFFILGILVLVYVLDKAVRSLKVNGYSQKYVFITGCDSGFGQLLALHLDGLGFPVFASCLTTEGQNFLSGKASSRLFTLPLDVTSSGSIQKAFEFVQSKLPQGSGLWALVNNAGITGPPVPTEMTPIDEFYKTCAVNLLGPVEICQKFLPLIRKVKGRVVNISSVMGRNACTTPSYNTSKFGMEGFTDSLRREVHHMGIKVSILEPGFFLTNIIDRNTLLEGFRKYYGQADDEVKRAYGGDFVEKQTAITDEILNRANPNTSLVVDAFTHAIVSLFPRTRYVLGWDAWLFYVPLSWLPGGVADWIIRQLRAVMSKNAKRLN